ncbi:OLC1v1020068C1 [Oldenlandia corymbosa var. corymbosa]|uniref:OLC1v1020068C1 n=1 Tax=Oldenlandia corymbosa var. corymbosa TaxID=529605 RepID=A0AAV1EFG3_OLDCO|nr:OLC1v1020068C1 [Oldenlandia corymbosa var. corymbosa]
MQIMAARRRGDFRGYYGGKFVKGDQDYYRGRGQRSRERDQNPRDRFRLRQKKEDVKVSGSREPGEISSASDNGGGEIDSESLKKIENGKRKFKFSPILWWDRDGGDERITRIVKSRRTNPPPAESNILPDSTKPDGRINSSVIQDYAVQDSERQPLVKRVDEAIDVPSQSTTVLPQLEPEVEEEKKALHDDDMSTKRKLRASRWANKAELLGDEEMNNLKKKKNEEEELEPGELRREGSHDDVSKVDEDWRSYVSGFSSHSDNESDKEDVSPPRTLNMRQGCRSFDEFHGPKKIGEGTYGTVYKAKDTITGDIVALKEVKILNEREGFPITALREINVLLSLHHSSIVDVKEVVVDDKSDKVYIVMEYIKHDLKAVMENANQQPFSESEVKRLMRQLLKGVKYLHQNWILHRDLKPANILIKENRRKVKICDFGLARGYGSPSKPYTQTVVTLLYRAPELLLGAKEYSTAIDMWSLGCIMAELLIRKPLFGGKHEKNQKNEDRKNQKNEDEKNQIKLLDSIFEILGTPSEEIWPGLSNLPDAKKFTMAKKKGSGLRAVFAEMYFTGSPVTLSDEGFELLNKLLTYDPKQRITAEDALKLNWFRKFPPLEPKEDMPTFPTAEHAQDRHLKRVQNSPDPLEEKRRKVLKLFG